MQRWVRLAFGGLSLAAVSCTLLDSVSGYAGPPEKQPKGGGGGGGVDAAAGAAGSAGTQCASNADCDDHDACNGVESCGADGRCVLGLPPNLDDGDSCTIDSCDPTKGVQHVLDDFPTVIQCLAGAGGDCAPDHYRSTMVCCYADCGDCPYFVNGVTCDRACTATLDVCCGINATDCDTVQCPGGYSKGAVKPSTCVCAQDGFAVECTR
jgi:hypothetical protein